MSCSVWKARERRPASVRRISRSVWTSSTTPGLRIFTTTSRPSRSRARCAWPIEAVASGVVSNHAKISSTEAPKSSRTVSASASNGIGVVLSVNRANARQ